MRVRPDAPHAAAVWFGAALVAAVMLWYYATAFLAPRADEGGGALMDLLVDPRTLSGVQRREQTHCRARARRRLWELTALQRMRALMLRDGAVWTVVAGEALSVAPGAQPSYYLRDRGPVTDGAGTAGGAGAVAVPAGMTLRANASVDPSALSPKADAVMRFATVAAARAALPADTDTERHYIFVTGLAADPSAYVVRVVRGAPNDGLVAVSGRASAVLLQSPPPAAAAP
jgi:hypothetical protein